MLKLDENIRFLLSSQLRARIKYHSFIAEYFVLLQPEKRKTYKMISQKCTGATLIPCCIHNWIRFKNRLFGYNFIVES